MTMPGIWYHGSPYEFKEFRPPKRYSPQEHMGFGIHFAKDPKFAALYGKNIYKCRLYPKHVFNSEELTKVGTVQDKMGREFFRGARIAPYISQGVYYFNIDLKPPKRAEEILKKYGYDAVYYIAKWGSRHMQHPSQGYRVTNQSPAVVMLYPEQVEVIDKFKTG